MFRYYDMRLERELVTATSTCIRLCCFTVGMVSLTLCLPHPGLFLALVRLHTIRHNQALEMTCASMTFRIFYHLGFQRECKDRASSRASLFDIVILQMDLSARGSSFLCSMRCCWHEKEWHLSDLVGIRVADCRLVQLALQHFFLSRLPVGMGCFCSNQSFFTVLMKFKNLGSSRLLDHRWHRQGSTAWICHVAHGWCIHNCLVLDVASWYLCKCPWFTMHASPEATLS